MQPRELAPHIVAYLYSVCAEMHYGGYGLRDPTHGSLTEAVRWQIIRDNHQLRSGILYWTPETGWTVRPNWRTVFINKYRTQIAKLNLELPYDEKS